MLTDGNKPMRSWGNKVNSEASSISSISDLKNMKNMIAEETNYTDSNALKIDNKMDDATPRKTCTKTYVLDSKLNKISFNDLSNGDDDVLTLLVSKFSGAKRLLAAGSCVLDKCNFRPVKSFALDVELSAIPGKTNSNKLMAIKKISIKLMDLEGASTFSKFLEIIKFSFTSELSLKKIRELATHKKIVVNVDVRQINKHSNWSYGEKTCFIGCNPNSYVRDRCAIVCFVDEASKLAAIGSASVFKSVNLYWAGFSLAHCAYCKQFGHISIMCSLSENSGICSKQMVTPQNQVHLTNIYRKKQAPIVYSVSFGGKTWAQVAGGSSSHVVLLDTLESSSSLGTKPAPIDSSFFGDFYLVDWLVFLECSLKLLMDQVSGIMKKLSFVELVLLASKLLIPLPVVLTSVAPNLNSDMTLDVMVVSLSLSLSIVADPVSDLGLSSSKVLTSKVGGLESKMVALEVSVDFVLEKLDHLCSGLGFDFVWNIVMCNVCSINVPAKQKDIVHWHRDSRNLFLGTGVAIIMNTSLAYYVCKVTEVSGQLLLVKLLFKNKLSVSILGFYAGTFLVVHFSQANDITSMIAKAVNESSFVVLGNDFNKDGFRKSVSFRKCLDLGLVNSLGMTKTIDFLFISLNLANAVVSHNVFDVEKFFDTDHQAVSVSMGLGTNESLISRNNFENAMLANAVMFSDEFTASVKFLDLDAMWDVVHKVMVLLANEKSSKYHKLELLVSKIVKILHKKSAVNFEFLMKCWVFLDSVGALAVQNIVDFGTGSGQVCFALCGIRKAYHTSKLAEFCRAKKATIRAAIDKRIESFEINKSHTIRSVLEHLFHKVVLDHLVVDNELVLKLDLVKSKCQVVDDVSSDWCCQYQPLEYVFDEAFSGVMCFIEFDKLFEVVFSLSNDKAKHCDKAVLNMLLVFLNFCLSDESVPSSWKETWVSIIPKPYKWEGTARKILFKILSNGISLACSTFDVLCGDNFSLVLQDMRKAYDSVGWKHLEKNLTRIKMYSKFICFFDSIYKNCTNCVMTDFGLMSGYWVHDDLDQGEIFSLLLVCGYRLNSYFISKNSCAESWAELSFFFTAGTFVDDTIWYLGIFLSTKGLSKPSLAKANSNVCFFTNLVLWKTVSDKQLLYLVLAVLHPIVSYRTQFSFVPVGFENKIASFVSFANSGGVVDCLFSHRFHDLQVLCWHPVHPLSSLVYIHISASNNFLVGMVCVLLDCNLFLNSFLATSFQFCSGVPMSTVLGESKFLRFFPSLWQHGIAFVNQLHDHHSAVFNWYTFKCWKKLDPHGSVSEWFKLFVTFLNGMDSSSTLSLFLHGVSSLNILESSNFVSVCDHFLQAGASSLSVYTDGSLSNLGTASCKAGAAAYFEDIGLGLGVCVLGLMLSTLGKLQAIALLCSIFLDSQSALDTCKLELSLACSDFCNQYWVKCHHIVNHKVKGHSGVSGNECANVIAGAASLSNWHFSFHLDEHFLIANGGIVSGNSRYFVHDIYHSVYRVH
ncbi:hypothetical protein G9A89_008890 [Geosiphon pyriformis]|nr:hypothetical protein G9A89_008890 [Geosiphon pyriformis]